MLSKSTLSKISFLCLSVIFICTYPLYSATIYVYPWESTIQDGIDSANSGDTVLVDKPVGPYQYTGTGNCDISFHGKQIVLKSIHGPEYTPIDLEGSGTRAFIFNEGESSSAKLIGFKIKNGDVRYHNDSNNMADRNGGAIKLQASPVIENCIFENCMGEYGGAIYIKSVSGDTLVTPIIIDCEFIADSALYEYSSTSDYSGGAIYCGSGANPTITDCIFTNNFAWAYGGAISGINATINNCLFYLNSTDDTYGGAAGGAVFIADSMTIRGCTISKNYSPNGGGIYAGENSSSYIANNIIAFNYFTGIKCYNNACITFSCNNFWNHSGGHIIGYCDTTDVDMFTIFEDPLFCDISINNYYISSYSPCDEDSSNCGILIGKYNDNCDYCCNNPGDVNNDGVVNILDTSFLTDYLYRGGNPPPCPDEADPNNDCSINILDVTQIINYLYNGGPAPECGCIL